MKELSEEFGKRLRELRKEQKWSQEDLAAKLNLHYGYIGLLERGERMPGLATLDRIARCFGIKPVDLIAEDKELEGLSMKQKALIYIVRDSGPEKIEKIHKIAKILIEKYVKK